MVSVVATAGDDALHPGCFADQQVGSARGEVVAQKVDKGRGSLWSARDARCQWHLARARLFGVLRRILIVYREVALQLAQNAAGIDASALAQAATLFHAFGEEYHERLLEEQHIFPAVRKDQRTKSAYIFGAVCPELGKGTGLILPFCNAQTIAASGGLACC